MACAAPGKIRILIADSQAVIRAGVRLALEEQPGFSVVAEAEDLRSALRAIRSRKPTAAVVELGLPGGSPKQTAQAFSRQRGMSVVYLSGSSDADMLAAGTQQGARCIIAKSAPIESLFQALRSGSECEPRRAAPLESSLERSAPRGGQPAWPGLTPREREVATLVAEGLAYRDVAERLHISDHTVKNHLRRIYDKLDINSRVELAVHGVRGAA